jgi:hypothetical protein
MKPKDIVMDAYLKDQPAFEAQVRAEVAFRTLPAPVVDAQDWLRREPPAVDPVLLDTFDTGDKVSLIGASKTRKSFFALQEAVCLAAGRDFLAWRVPRPRRVLMVQTEIQERHYWRRVRRMCEALGIAPEEIADRLQVVNGRGCGIGVEHLQHYAEETRAEMVVVDPLYKFNRGDENSAENMAALMSRFDELTQSTGAAVKYVHHDGKGSPGDRETRDRGSGSGVLGRDYDACVTLTEHRDQEDALVIGVLLRNYPPQEGFTVVWQDGCFRLAADLAALAATSSSKAEQRQRGMGLNELVEVVCRELVTKPWRMDLLKAEIQRRYCVGRKRSEEACRLLSNRDDLELARTETFPARVLIGPLKMTQAEAMQMTKKWQKRELDL